jgi:NTE family protein
MAARGRRPRAINLALQGGGAHGAFTWGVLDRLLEDPGIDFDGVCGTSAGAMNAVLLAHGLETGGREGARAALEGFWRRVGAFGAPAAAAMARAPAFAAFSHWFLESFSRSFSPYQFNPLDANPLRDLLARSVDFDAVRRCAAVKLFVCATNVRSGKVRIFDNAELSLDAVMASACLPHLFRAVAIDGEHYWDGGYMGNPALWPLFYRTAVRDVLIVMVNPIARADVPRTPVEIADRVNEITFNSSLLRELRAVEFVTRLVTDGALTAAARRRLRHVLVHVVRADEALGGLGATSKVFADWPFLQRLRDLGRGAAHEWLAAHRGDIGVRGSVDLRREFVDG